MNCLGQRKDGNGCGGSCVFEPDVGVLTRSPEHNTERNFPRSRYGGDTRGGCCYQYPLLEFGFSVPNIKFFMQFARNPVSYAPISATQQFRRWTRQESCNVTGCNLLEILCGAGFPEGGARV